MKPYYDSGGIMLYHGDCRDVLPTLGPVDHVITDPPYGDETHSRQWVGHALTKGNLRYPRNFHGAGAKKEIGFDAIPREQVAEVCAWCATYTTRWVLTFSSFEITHWWREEGQALGLESVRTCVWVKPDSAPQFTGDRPAAGAEAINVLHRPGKKRWNGGGRRGVFTEMVNNYGRSERAHPTQKPLSLMAELVSLFTDPGDLILDPFSGSGTTLLAAKNLGRRAIGVELEEKWCEVTVKRLAQEVMPLDIPRYDGGSSATWLENLLPDEVTRSEVAE